MRPDSPRRAPTTIPATAGSSRTQRRATLEIETSLDRATLSAACSSA